MSATISRLLLSIAIALSAAVLYVPVFMIVEQEIFPPDSKAFMTTNGICAVFLVVAWMLVWRNEIRWTMPRRVLTGASTLIALIPAILVVLSMRYLLRRREENLQVIVGGMIWAISWMVIVALIWRETQKERAERLRMVGIGAIECPACGYNLTGLKEARCPECGEQYTIDQLFAAAREQSGDLH